MSAAASPSGGRLPAPVFLLPGLLLGFLLGGVPPRMRLAEVEEELALLKDRQFAERSRAARLSPLSVVGLGPGGPMAEPMAKPQGEAPSPGPDARPTAGPPPPDTGPAPAVDPGPPPSMMAEFNLAVDAQRLRREQTRAALIEQAELGTAEVARLDELSARMNERLAALGPELMAMMDAMQGGQEPSQADLLGLTHEVTGVLYEAQVALDELVGERAGDVEDSAREVWNLVDLEVFRGAVQAAEDARGGG